MHKILPLLTFLSTFGFGQILDFENLDEIKPGGSIHNYSFVTGETKVRFFSGFGFENTFPMTLQRVGLNTENGGFYGVESEFDCNGEEMVEANSVNQINENNYLLNETISNRERVGCNFISGILIGNTMPSIFIAYDTPVMSCSGDLLDVDGNDNSIEAYDIYYYSDARNYPDSPINTKPIKIRSLGQTYGPGIIGDNGGVFPFKIEAERAFKLIEIRPIMQVTPKNTVRTVFGFALDNFSPASIETGPYTAPYLTDNAHKIEPLHPQKEIVKVKNETKNQEPKKTNLPFLEELTIYFDFDAYSLTVESKKRLDTFISQNANFKSRTWEVIGYTDPKGSENYNLKLAELRAVAVKEYLTQKEFYSEELIPIIKGESFNGPVNSIDWQKRCVHIVLN